MTLRDEAHAEFPGTYVPDVVKESVKYSRYWRKLALWAYKWGPVLLEEKPDESTGSH